MLDRDLPRTPRGAFDFFPLAQRIQDLRKMSALQKGGASRRYCRLFCQKQEVAKSAAGGVQYIKFRSVGEGRRITVNFCVCPIAILLCHSATPSLPPSLPPFCRNVNAKKKYPKKRARVFRYWMWELVVGFDSEKKRGFFHF